MNTDIRLQTSFLTHRKRKKLESRLGKTAVLSLIDLWLSVAVNKPKGILKDMDHEDIAMDANWGGDPKQFCDALVDIGFMDFKEGVYYIHDWKEHQSYAFHADERSELARKAALVRWRKKEKKIEENLDDNAEGMRDALQNDADGMRIDAEGNAPSPTPTPSPVPSPSPSLKDNIADSVPESANLTIEDENGNSKHMPDHSSTDCDSHNDQARYRTWEADRKDRKDPTSSVGISGQGDRGFGKVPNEITITLDYENDSNNNEVNDKDGGIGNGKRKCICDGNQQPGSKTLLPGVGTRGDERRGKGSAEENKLSGRDGRRAGIGEQGTPQGAGCGMEGNEGARRKDCRTGNGDQNCKNSYGSDETYGPSLTGCGEEDKKPGNGESKGCVPDICLGGGDTNPDREFIRECGGKISGDAGGKPEEPKYRTKKNRWLKGQRLADFEEFWIAFDYKKGKAAAADSWLDIKDYSPEKAKWIIYAAKKEAWERDGIIQRGGTPKWCQGWLTDRRWEDYPMESQSSQKRRFKSKEEMKKEIYEKYGNPLLRETSSGEHKENASAGNNAGGYVPAGNALQILFGKTI